MKPETVIETAVPSVSSPEGEAPKGKVEKKGGKRIGYNYIILKSLKESLKNDVVKCIYIKSLTDFGICVIKEGTAGELKDKEGRDIKDRLIWQRELHELLQDKVRVPRYIGSFEENGNYYLAIEHIKGKTLGDLFKEYGGELRAGLLKGNKLGIRFLGYLIRIIDLLDTLHKHHIVHRDVSSANFMITPKGKVAVIDMELSYSLYKQMPAPPFQLGTYGYMSPEQLAIATPTVKEDVFSIGAILLQSWTGISPIKLTQAPFEELKNKVNFFIPDINVANIVFQCLSPNAEERPLLKDVYLVVEQYRSDLKNRIKREPQKPPLLSKEQIEITIQRAINTLGSPLLADKERGWFAESRDVLLKKEKSGIHKEWYTSFHLGSTGVLYFLSKAHLMGFDIEPTRPHIDHTLALIETKYINHIEKTLPGLHFGADGIAASLAEAMRCGLIDPSDKYLSWINSLLKRQTELPGIVSGVAGQGMANLLYSTIANTEEIIERLHGYSQYLLSRQEKDGSWIRRLGNGKQKGRITRGFAHGVAGIILFLLEYGQYYNDRQSISGAEFGLKWLMKNAIVKKDFIEWKSSEGKRVFPWWSDGGPGIAIAFIKAYRFLGNPLYKEFATGALHFHPERVFNSNLSQHNGLSGLGEIYLEAYHSLQDEQWLERAGWIAQVIMNLKKHHKTHGIYWLAGYEKQPVPGFMLGNSGILHFLLKYCYPDKINAPLTPCYDKILATDEAPNANLITKSTYFS